jgi:hypothetical protein
MTEKTTKVLNNLGIDLLAKGLGDHTKLLNSKQRFGMIWSPLQAVNLQFNYNINSIIYILIDRDY